MKYPELPRPEPYSRRLAPKHFDDMDRYAEFVLLGLKSVKNLERIQVARDSILPRVPFVA